MGAMRAAVLRTPRRVDANPLELTEVADPSPGEGELLVEVSACAVCRTDLQLCEGDLGAHRLPVIPGHQIVGRVRETGAGVDTGRVGSRVGVCWLAGSCGVCDFCRHDRENLCEQATFTGWDRDGGFASRVTVRADVAFDLPTGFADLAAAPLLCGGVIGYRSLRVAEVTAGQRLGLYGFGASATCAIQVARHWGCEVFVCTRSAAEQQRALDLGAVWAAGYDTSPPEPLDAAVTFAPSGDVVVAALRSLRRGGIVAINAIHLDRVPEFPYELLWWERQLRSVANVTRADIVEFLDIAAAVPVRTQVETFALADANVALKRLASGRIRGAAVLTMT